MLVESIVTSLFAKGMDLLGGLITGASEVGAKKITDFIQDKTGINISSPSNIENLSSEDIVKINNAVIEYNVSIARLKLEELQIRTKDVQDARRHNENIYQMGPKNKSPFEQTFAWAWSAFAFLYILGVTFFQVPENNIRFADTVLGFLLGTIVSTLINYFFGSSNMANTNTSSVSYPTTSSLKGVGDNVLDNVNTIRNTLTTLPNDNKYTGITTIKKEDLD